MLSEAIEEGNVADTEEFVTKLVDKKTKIQFTPLTPKKVEFNILIQIEDKNESEGTLVTESVDPYNTTILMLKYQVRSFHIQINTNKLACDVSLHHCCLSISICKNNFT